jgi:predicted MPP superfamily phosphohydrolase
MRLRKRSWILLALSVLLLALFVYANQIEPYNIEVTRYHISAPLKSPIKIAHLTDLHTSGLGRRERRMLAILEEEKPDLIVVTGDQISVRHSYSGCREVLQKLSAPLGVWVVPGNHDNWTPPPDGRTFYDNLGVNYLVNQSKAARDDLWIVGLDDAMTGRPDLKTAMREVPPDVYTIALFHSPVYFETTAGKCNLSLAGHSHGGQVRLPYIEPAWLPRGCKDYVEGWFERDGSKMYVSRGLGMSILPIRFNCRPEIAIITLGE